MNPMLPPPPSTQYTGRHSMPATNDYDSPMMDLSVSRSHYTNNNTTSPRTNNPADPSLHPPDYSNKYHLNSGNPLFAAAGNGGGGGGEEYPNDMTYHHTNQRQNSMGVSEGTPQTNHSPSNT